MKLIKMMLIVCTCKKYVTNNNNNNNNKSINFCPEHLSFENQDLVVS